MTQALWGPEQPTPPAEPGTVSSLLATHRGLARRRYVVFPHGPRAHLYDRYLKHAGIVALCGKTKGEVQSYREVADRLICQRCWERSGSHGAQ